MTDMLHDYDIKSPGSVFNDYTRYTRGYFLLILLSKISGILRVTPGEDKPADPFLDRSSLVDVVV